MIDEPSPWGRDVLLGVSQFAREYGKWELIRGSPQGKPIWESFGSFRRYDAVITSRPNDPRALQLFGKGVPMIAAANAGPPSMPSVLADDFAVGRLAAEYFATLGYRRFAILMNTQPHSQSRFQGMSKWLAAHHLPPPVQHVFPRLGQAEVTALQRWVRRLEKPIALFACNDTLALPVMQACRSSAISVPDDVSVLGVDNAVFDCEMATPPLSSIDHNLRGVGYAAAELLAAVLRGEKVPQQLKVIAPIGVVERGSTAARAIPDSNVTQALALIRENARFGLTVEDVLEHLMVSRATLDRAFKRWIGRSAHEEIQRCRIERARELLAHTNLDMNEVGARSGFNYRQQFHTAFRSATGLTPREFRLQAGRSANSRRPS